MSLETVGNFRDYRPNFGDINNNAPTGGSYNESETSGVENVPGETEKVDMSFVDGEEPTAEVDVTSGDVSQGELENNLPTDLSEETPDGQNASPENINADQPNNETEGLSKAHGVGREDVLGTQQGGGVTQPEGAKSSSSELAGTAETTGNYGGTETTPEGATGEAGGDRMAFENVDSDFEVTSVSTDLDIDFSDPSSIDYASLTDEDIQYMIGQMTQEEYDAFIEGLKSYYEQNIEYYNTLLNGTEEKEGVLKLIKILEKRLGDIRFFQHLIDETKHSLSICIGNAPDIFGFEELGINAEEFEQMSLNDQLNTMLDALARKDYTGDDFDSLSTSEKIELLKANERYNTSYLFDFVANYENYFEQKAALDEKIDSELSYLGIHSYEDFMKEYNGLLNYKGHIEEAIKTTQNMIDSAYYDNLKYLKAYQEYEYYTPTEQDKADLADYISYSGISDTHRINYTEYAKTHPNVTPLAFIEMLKEYNSNIFTNPLANYTIIGINNSSELYDLLEVAEAYPDFAKTYDYLYTNEGPDSAAEFLKKCKYEINNIRGQLRAREFLNTLDPADGLGDETLETIANELKISKEALLDGLEDFVAGGVYTIEALLTALGIIEENRTMRIEEYETMYIIQALLSQEEKEALGLIYLDEATNEYKNSDPNSIIDYTKQYSGGSLLKHTYQIVKGIGNMLPSIAISTVCPLAGSVAMGISAGGNAYHQAMVEGHSLLSSIMYGIFTGFSEAISERILGGLPGLSDVNVTSLFTYLKAAGREGVQEVFQEIMDLTYQWSFMGKELPTTEEEWKEILDEIKWSGIYGAITAGIMQVPSLASAMISVHGFNTIVNDNNISQSSIDQALAEIRQNPEFEGMTDAEIKALAGKQAATLAQRNQLMADHNINITAANMMMNSPDFTLEMAQRLSELMNSGLDESAAIAQLDLEIKQAQYINAKEKEGYTTNLARYAFENGLTDNQLEIIKNEMEREGLNDSKLSESELNQLRDKAIEIEKVMIENNVSEDAAKYMIDYKMNKDTALRLETLLKNPKENASEIYDLYKENGLFNGKYAPSKEIFMKYADIYTNEMFCNIESGSLKWPSGEGSAQYGHMTDQQFVKFALEHGITGLEELGAERVQLSDLEGVELSRYKNNTSDGPYTDSNADSGGEYFGNTTDSDESRSLMPAPDGRTQFVYTFSGSDGSELGSSHPLVVNGTEYIVGENAEIVCMRTQAAPWFGDPGGAEQDVFYLRDTRTGQLIAKSDNSLYKVSVADLEALGIIIGKSINN